MPFVSKYTLDEKMNVCNYYVVLGGNSKSAARKTGIPAQTIRDWTKTDWWATMVQEIRKRHQDRLDGKFTAVIDRLYATVMDRVKNGDDVLWAKTGEIVKRGISAKDAGVLLNMVIEKRALLRGDPTSRSSTMSVEKQMKSIQDQLEQRTINQRKQIDDSDNVEEMHSNEA